MLFPITAEIPDSYDKLDRWPLLDTYIRDHYRLAVERGPAPDVLWSSRAEPVHGYRIYLRKP